MALAIGHMAMLHINRESDAFENPMLRNLYKESRSLHCIAVTESLSYCVHHYNRSTSAGIFMARLHTTAILCSCQFLIFDSRPTFRHSAYSESDRRSGTQLKTKHMSHNQTVTLPPTSEECTVGLVKQFD